jgi:hypothetical protein
MAWFDRRKRSSCNWATVLTLLAPFFSGASHHAKSSCASSASSAVNTWWCLNVKTSCRDEVSLNARVNLRRRHLSQGQRAMLAAMALLESSKPQAEAAEDAGVSQQRISQACAILKYNQEDVEGVISSTVQFDAAYEKGQAEQGERDGSKQENGRLEKTSERSAKRFALSLK